MKPPLPLVPTAEPLPTPLTPPQRTAKPAFLSEARRVAPFYPLAPGPRPLVFVPLPSARPLLLRFLSPRPLVALFLLAAFALLAPAAATWADRAEYDLALSIRSEGTAQKRLALLDEWTKKYPRSEMSLARQELYLDVYHTLGDGTHMLQTVHEMLAAQSDNALASYWCVVLTPGAKDASPASWKLAEDAAHRLLTGTSSGAEWQKQKPANDLLAHRTLGWIEWQRGDQTAAAADFTAYLKQQPNDAEISGWFGLSLAALKKPESTVPALWHLVRAGSLKGPGALPEGRRHELDTLAEHVYVSYHGQDPDALDSLRAAAVTAAFPPADFTIESADAVAARKAEEELKRTNPQLALWMSMRKELDGLYGDKYFTETLKPAPMPKLKGTVIACSPAASPTEVSLGLSNGVAPEVTLKFAAPLPACAPPGTEIQFEGTADSFAKAPFLLTVLTDPTKIDGWPAPPAPDKK